MELLARPLDELAEDYLSCLERDDTKFLASAIEGHTCGASNCGSLYKRLINIVEYLRQRDDCNWAKRPADIGHDQEVLQEHRILTATMPLRLDWAEKQHPTSSVVSPAAGRW